MTGTVLVSCLAVLTAREALPAGAPQAFAFGAGVAALNALASMALLVWARPRPAGAFMRALLGGMVGRMAVMLAAAALGLVALDLPRVPLVIGLLGHFVAFLVLELGIVHISWKPAGAR